MESVRDRNKQKALLISILLYVGLAVLFLFIGLKYPDPPIEESGIEISMADFGYDDTGSGEIEPSESNSQTSEITEEVQEQVTEQISEAVQEEVVTQEESEISVPDNTQETENEITERPEVVEQITEAEAEPEPEPQINERLQNAMGAWNESESTGSEGSQADTQGNEGVESGNVDGKGTFGGNGSSFELGGRSMISGPKVGEKPKEEGKVVLNIWVDRQGNIVRTSRNLKESTTTSQELFNLANKAALKAKFNPSSNAAPEQRGKMTFIFILR